MIKKISEITTEDGYNEQTWLLALYGDNPQTISYLTKNKSKVDSDADVRSERAEIVCKTIAAYIDAENKNGLPKEITEVEAINRLMDLQEYCFKHKYEVEKNCRFVIKLKDQLKRIARPGRQYRLYLILINMAEEQIKYEEELKRLEE